MKVQQALSFPKTFTRATGNVSICQQTAAGPTAQFFQPHLLSTVGSPAIPPTLSTQIPIYLLDYTSVSAMIQNVLPGVGSDQSSFRQQVVISGVMEYTIRNHTNEPIKYKAYLWEINKANMPPLDVMGIPGNTTTPVPTGNYLNLFGNGIFQNNLGTQSDATNPTLLFAEVDPTKLPFVRRWFKYKQVSFTLHPGMTKKFKIGVKRVLVDTSEHYSPNTGALGLYTDNITWCSSFINGAKGIIFRHYTEAGVVNAAARTVDNDLVAFNPCESSVHTLTKYWVYHKVSAFQNTSANVTLLADSGINTSATVDFMNEEKDEEVSGAIA